MIDSVSHPWPYILYHLFRVTMLLAFPGIAIYTIVGGFYAMDRGSRSRKDLQTDIPKPIRKVGFISMLIFLAAFLGGLVVFLIFSGG